MPTVQIEARCAFAVSTSSAANLRPARMASNGSPNWVIGSSSPKFQGRVVAVERPACRSTDAGFWVVSQRRGFNGRRRLGDSGGLEPFPGPASGGHAGDQAPARPRQGLQLAPLPVGPPSERLERSRRRPPSPLAIRKYSQRQVLDIDRARSHYWPRARPDRSKPLRIA